MGYESLVHDLAWEHPEEFQIKKQELQHEKETGGSSGVKVEEPVPKSILLLTTRRVKRTKTQIADDGSKPKAAQPVADVFTLEHSNESWRR